MATLVAIGYPDEATPRPRADVQRLEADLVIQADQVAAISRDQQGKYHITTTHGGASTAMGVVWGGFWGLLFGRCSSSRCGLGGRRGFGALFGHLGKTRSTSIPTAGTRLR